MIRLTRREKLLAVALAILAGSWGLFALAVKPALERTRTLRRVISEKQDELGKQYYLKPANLEVRKKRSNGKK